MNERVEGGAEIRGEDLADGRRGFRLPRGVGLFGPLLGLAFLAYPIRAVLTSDPTPARTYPALGGAGIFAGAFLWLIWTRGPLLAAAGRPSEVRKRWAAIAFLATLAVVLNLTLGTEWRVLFFHANVAAGMVLPTRGAYAAITCLAAITLALGASSGMAWLVLPTAILGLWATAFVRQVATVAELRAAREELARLAVSEERLRFARDLHDLLGHSLSLITLKSELAGRLLPSEPEKAAREVGEVESVARQALREVREAVAGYRRPTLEGELAGAREMLEAAGIACRTENGTGPLPAAADAALAWAVREGATNVMRHSRAGSCRILLTRAGSKVYAEVTDDGPGSSAGAGGSTTGSGLSGLAERVAGFPGSELEAGPLPGGGFRLRVGLPVGGEGRR